MPTLPYLYISVYLCAMFGTMYLYSVSTHESTYLHGIMINVIRTIGIFSWIRRRARTGRREFATNSRLAVIKNTKNHILSLYADKTEKPL